MLYAFIDTTRSQLEVTELNSQAVREELRGAASLRDSIAESIAEQEVLASSIQESLAALAQLQCQHEDLQTLRESDTRSTKDEHVAVEVISIRSS